VRLISITQDLGDDPMSVMMRRIMTLFDEYQSKENGKHTLRAMKENSRQGFWNGALPPIGYRIAAAEQREDQEEAGDRSDPRRHGASDLQAGAHRRRAERTDGDQVDHHAFERA
jgi:DNA invertase Pin-like site-specific DNA recombinase